MLESLHLKEKGMYTDSNKHNVTDRFTQQVNKFLLIKRNNKIKIIINFILIEFFYFVERSSS